MNYNDDECRIYLQRKNDADYYPWSVIKYSSNYWNKYRNNVCPVYLIDKYYHQYFLRKSYFRINHQKRLLNQGEQITNYKQIS